MDLKRVSVSDMDNNCYLLFCKGEGLLIDAADDAPRLLGLAAECGVRITKVVTTHAHWDHVRALGEVLAATGAVHYASALDAPELPCGVDVELVDGDVIEFCGVELPVVVLRGHTAGGVCVVAELGGVPDLFVGDGLFPGGLGKTGSVADFELLFSDVSSRLFDRFPDDAVVWPGHGASTTLGAERGSLGSWWERKW